MEPLTCFKAYDVRGKLGTNLIVKLFVELEELSKVLNTKKVVVGFDEGTSLSLALSLNKT